MNVFDPGKPIEMINMAPDLQLRKLQIDICYALIETLKVINSPVFIIPKGDKK